MPARIKLDGSTWASVTDVQVKTSANSWGIARSAWLKTDATTWVRWFLGPITDAFNRSVSGGLGTADSGETWTNRIGTWYANGSAAQSDTAASSNALATVAYGVSDVTVGASITNGTGVAAWVVDANNWYALVSFQTQVNTTFSCNCFCNGRCESFSVPVYNSCANCAACGSTTTGGGTTTTQYPADCTTTITGYRYLSAAQLDRSCPNGGTLVSTRCYSCDTYPYVLFSPANLNCASIFSSSDTRAASSYTATRTYSCPQGGENFQPSEFSCYTPITSTSCLCPQGGINISGTCFVTTTTPGTTVCGVCQNSSCSIAYYDSVTQCFSGGTYPNCDQYGGGCQTCGSITDAYYIKLIRSVGGTITNLTGDISVSGPIRSVRLNTQGDVLGYQAYSNGDFTGLLASNTYTATSPAKANNYGIIKTSSPFGQGSTVDNFRISG